MTVPMPTPSHRQQCLKDLKTLIQLEMLDGSSSAEWLSSSDSDSGLDDDMKLSTSDSDMELLESSDSDVGDLLELHTAMENSTYVVEKAVPVSARDVAEDTLGNLADRSFRQLTRMSKSTFFELVRRIETHIIFQNNSQVDQAPVSLQLAIALDRFGHSGNKACLFQTLLNWKVSNGSLVNYTHRSMEALELSLASEVQWPNRTQRARISKEFEKKGFPGCVGLIDGSLFVLSQRPTHQSETYLDYKARYSINTQIVCDDRKKITFMFTGMPGACQDYTCLQRSQLWRKFSDRSTFDEMQYLLGDSKYPPLPHLVPAFPTTPSDQPNQPTQEDIDKEDFNTCVTKASYVQDQCIGVLRSRWYSLTELKTQLKESEDNHRLVHWINCCVLLHNYVLNQNDEWSEEDEKIVIERENDPNQGPVSEPESNLLMEEAGLAIRSAVQAHCLSHNRQPGGFLFQ